MKCFFLYLFNSYNPNFFVLFSFFVYLIFIFHYFYIYLIGKILTNVILAILVKGINDAIIQTVLINAKVSWHVLVAILRMMKELNALVWLSNRNIKYFSIFWLHWMLVVVSVYEAVTMFAHLISFFFFSHFDFV